MVKIMTEVNYWSDPNVWYTRLRILSTIIKMLRLVEFVRPTYSIMGTLKKNPSTPTMLLDQLVTLYSDYGAGMGISLYERTYYSDGSLESSCSARITIGMAIMSIMTVITMISGGMMLGSMITTTVTHNH